MLTRTKRGQFENITTKLNNKDLKNKQAKYNNNKERVDAEVGERVDIVFLKGSSVEEVEDGEKQEDVEEYCEVLSVDCFRVVFESSYLIWDSKDVVTLEQDYGVDTNLEGSVQDNRSPH